MNSHAKPRSLPRGSFFPHFTAILFVAVILSFYLTLGTHIPAQMKVRLYPLSVLSLIFLLLNIPKVLKVIKSPSVLILMVFFIFLIVRTAIINLGFGPWGAEHGFMKTKSFYLEGIYYWAPLLLTFITSYVMMTTKKNILVFLNGLAWICFGMGLYTFARFGQHSLPEYFAPDGREAFFPFAAHKIHWIDTFLIARYAHANLWGDLLAVGFFCSLGLVIYAVHVKQELKRGKAFRESYKAFSATMSYMALRLVMAIAIGVSVFTLLSRGTILAFFVSLFLFGGSILFKFMRRMRSGLIIATILAGCLLLGWGVKWGRVFQELESIQNEKVENSGGALSLSVEGQKRAMAIFKDFKPWGAGQGGYEAVSRQYTSVENEHAFSAANSNAMNHFFQLMAEQGYGAFIYFLFLIVLSMELVVRLWRTKSYFKFIASVSFAAPVVMMLCHSAVGFILERYSVILLWHILAGASLAAVHPSFEHE